MKCEKIREEMLDLVLEATPSAEVREHLSGCPACSAELVSLKQTMALLDEWKAPEPSPYFNTRMQALLREEKAKATEKPSFVLSWFRKQVVMAAAAVALVVGSGIYAGFKNTIIVQQPPTQDAAVKDLQTLDKDQDVINNFAALDDDPSNDDQSAGTAE
ncbi:MAG TPA: hypothetical protein VGL89_05845 [Candidatus Koribacter sp.]|jgi:predicted anti-sigma-YlaC factor YlaD